MPFILFTSFLFIHVHDRCKSIVYELINMYECSLPVRLTSTVSLSAPWIDFITKMRELQIISLTLTLNTEWGACDPQWRRKRYWVSRSFVVREANSLVSLPKTLGNDIIDQTLCHFTSISVWQRRSQPLLVNIRRHSRHSLKFIQDGDCVSTGGGVIYKHTERLG